MILTIQYIALIFIFEALFLPSCSSTISYQVSIKDIPNMFVHMQDDTSKELPYYNIHVKILRWRPVHYVFILSTIHHIFYAGFALRLPHELQSVFSVIHWFSFFFKFIKTISFFYHFIDHLIGGKPNWSSISAYLYQEIKGRRKTMHISNICSTLWHLTFFHICTFGKEWHIISHIYLAKLNTDVTMKYKEHCSGYATGCWFWPAPVSDIYKDGFVSEPTSSMRKSSWLCISILGFDVQKYHSKHGDKLEKQLKFSTKNDKNS